ncbi:hypothetical protein ApDm4_0164 [Acetobacter pomorum]|nr:hypothetical protein ApDm4_0164 [Acetobacter pomorum]
MSIPPFLKISFLLILVFTFYFLHILKSKGFLYALLVLQT